MHFPPCLPCALLLYAAVSMAGEPAKLADGWVVFAEANGEEASTFSALSGAGSTDGHR